MGSPLPAVYTRWSRACQGELSFMAGIGRQIWSISKIIIIIIFQGLTASMIVQSGSIALPAVMGGTEIALQFLCHAKLLLNKQY